MKAKLKKCKGFEGVTCCQICVRKDKKEVQTLAQSVSIDPDSGRKTCVHFLFKKGDIRR
jgi:hypothetical protein